jgi:FKBP12-rapamycin complex-associated protein
MLAELAFSLRDDLRPHMPELLPRLVALFVDAERTGNYEMVKPGLEALEVNKGPQNIHLSLCCQGVLHFLLSV